MMVIVTLILPVVMKLLFSVKLINFKKSGSNRKKIENGGHRCFFQIIHHFEMSYAIFRYGLRFSEGGFIQGIKFEYPNK